MQFNGGKCLWLVLSLTHKGGKEDKNRRKNHDLASEGEIDRPLRHQGGGTAAGKNKIKY